MSLINQERVLTDFLELVRIGSPSKGERDVAAVVKQKLADYVPATAISEDAVGAAIDGNCGNIFIELPGTVAGAPRLLFNAHLDCVEPSQGVEPIVDDGIITSAANTILGGDDKAGVVAIIEALRVLHEQQIPHGAVQVVFTVAEESGLEGSKHLLAERLQADCGFALDSGGAPGSIVVAAPGQNSIKVIVQGKTAHAGVAPEQGVNAIVVAGKALTKLQQGRIDHETTANVGRICGGGATNIVPDTVELFCEARSRDKDKLQRQTEHMTTVFEQTAADNNAVATVEVSSVYQAFNLALDALPVKLAGYAATQLGLVVASEASGGGSDANFFNAYGVPTAVLGVGMQKVHTTEEYIAVEHLYQAAAWVVAIIQAAATKDLG